MTETSTIRGALRRLARGRNQTGVAGPQGSSSARGHYHLGAPERHTEDRAHDVAFVARELLLAHAPTRAVAAWLLSVAGPSRPTSEDDERAPVPSAPGRVTPAVGDILPAERGAPGPTEEIARQLWTWIERDVRRGPGPLAVHPPKIAPTAGGWFLDSRENRSSVTSGEDTIWHRDGRAWTSSAPFEPRFRFHHSRGDGLWTRQPDISLGFDVRGTDEAETSPQDRDAAPPTPSLTGAPLVQLVREPPA